MRAINVATKSVISIFLGVLVNLTMADELRQDGNWWSNQEAGEKAVYVIGFLDGMAYESKIWDMGLMVAEGKDFDPVLNRYAAKAETFANNNFKREFAHLTVGNIVDGLDKFYADYRNHRIEVSEAMVVVVRSMDGTPEDEISKLIEYKRKKASD